MKNKTPYSILFFVLALMTFYATSTESAEADYVEKYCEGVIEHVLSDRTRVDCLTAEYAIEYDFARKWAEAIGQSLHYARMTGKKPGIALIMTKEGDSRYLERVNGVIDEYQLPITFWTIMVSYEGIRFVNI